VIEAVFEELHIKKQVFAELEAIVSPECILATNTSSLSVTEMAADLKHPERLVGFHFFNPVAVMPLLEIVRAPRTDDAVLATAFELAKALKKTGVLVKDAAAFVVNRILLRLMGEVTAAFDEGTPAEVADAAGRKSFVGPSTAPAGTTRASTSSHAATTARNRCPAPRGVGGTRMTDTRSGLRSGHQRPVQGQPCRRGAGGRYGTGFPPHHP